MAIDHAVSLITNIKCAKLFCEVCSLVLSNLQEILEPGKLVGCRKNFGSFKFFQVLNLVNNTGLFLVFSSSTRICI